ncbi:MAG: TolC family protein [Armatimonadetes bacterium]|nr:TolC family protein [Armatimonadota bacterium]
MKTAFLIPLFGLTAHASAQPLTLDQALGSARQTRPAIAAARLRSSQAAKTRDSLGAYPALRLHAGVTDPLATGGSDDDLVLTQPLDVFGRTSAARRSGDALVAFAEAHVRRTVLDVQSEVVEAYIAAASSNELVRSAEKIEDIYVRLYDATRRRVDEGVEPGFHLTQVSLDLGQARLKTKLRKGERQAAYERLASLIGRTVPDEGVEGIPRLEGTAVVPPVPGDVRPDLQVLAAELQAAQAELRAARLVGAPELELQARRTPWQESDGRFGFRVQLNVPLFDFGRARSETAAARAKVEAAEKALADARSIADGERRSARTEVAAAEGQVMEHAALVGQARELVERLRPGLTEQATTLIEVLDASRVLRDIEQAHVEAQARLASARAKLLRAEGRVLEVGP